MSCVTHVKILLIACMGGSYCSLLRSFHLTVLLYYMHVPTKRYSIAKECPDLVL